jgi:hypothetical protein
LAIMSSDIGAFGKLMSEATEAADRRPVDGVVSAGGSRLHAIRFGLVPQVLPVYASQVLYFFESNTRSATIIGIVGAGGIGLQLSEQIRVLEWQQVSFLILMIPGYRRSVGLDLAATAKCNHRSSPADLTAQSSSGSRCSTASTSVLSSCYGSDGRVYPVLMPAHQRRRHYIRGGPDLGRSGTPRAAAPQLSTKCGGNFSLAQLQAEPRANSSKNIELAVVIPGETHDDVSGAGFDETVQKLRGAGGRAAVAGLSLAHHRGRLPIIGF